MEGRPPTAPRWTRDTAHGVGGTASAAPGPTSRTVLFPGGTAVSDGLGFAKSCELVSSTVRFL